MDPKGLDHINNVVAGQQVYESLLHVFDAHGYKRSVIIDSKDALNGVYKIERWTADDKPTVLVTVNDNDLIEVWGSPELWAKGVPTTKIATFVDHFIAMKEIDEGLKED